MVLTIPNVEMLSSNPFGICGPHYIYEGRKYAPFCSHSHPTTVPTVHLYVYVRMCACASVYMCGCKYVFACIVWMSAHVYSCKVPTLERSTALSTLSHTVNMIIEISW